MVQVTVAEVQSRRTTTASRSSAWRWRRPAPVRTARWRGRASPKVAVGVLVPPASGCRVPPSARPEDDVVQELSVRLGVHPVGAVHTGPAPCPGGSLSARTRVSPGTDVVMALEVTVDPSWRWSRPPRRLGWWCSRLGRPRPRPRPRHSPSYHGHTGLTAGRGLAEDGHESGVSRESVGVSSRPRCSRRASTGRNLPGLSP